MKLSRPGPGPPSRSQCQKNDRQVLSQSLRLGQKSKTSTLSGQSRWPRRLRRRARHGHGPGPAGFNVNPGPWGAQGSDSGLTPQREEPPGSEAGPGGHGELEGKELPVWGVAKAGAGETRREGGRRREPGEGEPGGSLTREREGRLGLGLGKPVGNLK
eukprot:2235323-Rhodomonas_salina.1